MTQRFFSTGFIAGHHQVPVTVVERAAKEADVEPVVQYNEVVYFDHDGLDKIIKVLNATVEWREVR